MEDFRKETWIALEELFVNRRTRDRRIAALCDTLNGLSKQIHQVKEQNDRLSMQIRELRRYIDVNVVKKRTDSHVRIKA